MGDHWRRLWRLLQDRVLAQDLLDGRAATITCDQLAIESAAGVCLLQQLQGTLQPDPTSLCATVRLHVPDTPGGSSVQIAVRRLRETASPRTELLVDTQAQSLPLGQLPAIRSATGT